MNDLHTNLIKIFEEATGVKGGIIQSCTNTEDGQVASIGFQPSWGPCVNVEIKTVRRFSTITISTDGESNEFWAIAQTLGSALVDKVTIYPRWINDKKLQMIVLQTGKGKGK